ncbi:MAG: copper resistance protein B [Mariprofundus sp.]|nr:copper resistance protein B [Mariprofundus sp.]
MSVFTNVCTCMISVGVLLSSAMAETMPMQSTSGTAGMVQGGSMQGGSAPADARSSDYSDGYQYRGMAGWEETDEMTVSKIIADQMEYRSNNNGNNSLRWDMQGWSGTDYNKLWFKFEGDDEGKTRAGNLELQTLYSHSVSAFWDFQIGGRYDRFYSPGLINDRFLAVIGFQGLAPYWFEVEPALFVSDQGDVSARITATYDLLFTQRLILQPRFEVNAALTEVPQFGVGKGVNDIQLGMRLRYEIAREFAPYLGIAWQRQFGATANLVRAGGEVASNVSLIAGLRWWF